MRACVRACVHACMRAGMYTRSQEAVSVMFRQVIPNFSARERNVNLF